MLDALTLNDKLTIANLALILFTLIAIGLQSFFAKRSLDLLILSMRYAKHAELSKFLLDHPELIDYSVRQETLRNFRSLEGDPDDVRRRKIYLDMLIDNAEFFFLSSKYTNKKHNNMLVRRMMTNEKLKEHWKSNIRGSVNVSFEKFVDDFYSAQEGKR